MRKNEENNKPCWAINFFFSGQLAVWNSFGATSRQRSSPLIRGRCTGFMELVEQLGPLLICGNHDKSSIERGNNVQPPVFWAKLKKNEMFTKLNSRSESFISEPVDQSFSPNGEDPC